MTQAFRIIFPALAISVAAPCARAETGIIRSGINQEIFSDALDPDDLRIVLENIIKSAAFGGVPHKTQLYQDGNSLLRGLERKEFDMFAMTSLRYLRNRHLAIEPTLLLQSKGKKWQRHLMLANAEKSLGKTLADFEGTQITILDNGVTGMIRLWMDVALGRESLPRSEDFFEDIALVEKPNQAAIPVFFGKKGLCVISEDHWNMLAVLNPKMKERLRVVARSPGFVPGILLYRGGTDPGIKRLSKEALVRMHKSPRGKQILRFGQIEKIVPAAREDLQPSIDLYLEHQEMWGRDKAIEKLAAKGVAEEPN